MNLHTYTYANGAFFSTSLYRKSSGAPTAVVEPLFKHCQSEYLIFLLKFTLNFAIDSKVLFNFY